jgi:hypothetical protein
MNKKILYIALLLTSLAVPATAKGVFYACDMAVKRADGWVSPKIGLVFDGQGGVQVVDSVTLNFLDGPVHARIKKRADKSRITWSIAGAKDSKGEIIPTLKYIAQFDLKRLTISVVAKPVGYPQRFSGKGKCAIQKTTKNFLRR